MFANRVLFGGRSTARRSARQRPICEPRRCRSSIERVIPPPPSRRSHRFTPRSGFARAPSASATSGSAAFDPRAPLRASALRLSSSSLLFVAFSRRPPVLGVAASPVGVPRFLRREPVRSSSAPSASSVLWASCLRHGRRRRVCGDRAAPILVVVLVRIAVRASFAFAFEPRDAFLLGGDDGDELDSDPAEDDGSVRRPTRTGRSPRRSPRVAGPSPKLPAPLLHASSPATDAEPCDMRRRGFSASKS